MAFSTSSVLGVDLTQRKTSAEFSVGTRVAGTDGSEWVYVQASGAITAGYWVNIDEDFQAALATDALCLKGQDLGVATAAFADNDYGFICVKGSNLTAALGANCAADIELYMSTTAGVLDDSTSVTGTRILGARPVAANTVSTAAALKEVGLTYPRAAAF